ncbi:hypothetical protein ACTUM2_15555, partial [Listeria monocytogenes]
GTMTVSAPALNGFTLNPSSMAGGSSTIGTLTISGAAPSGFYAQLTSDTTSVQLPNRVNFPVGATSASFTIT